MKRHSLGQRFPTLASVIKSIDAISTAKTQKARNHHFREFERKVSRLSTHDLNKLNFIMEKEAKKLGLIK